MSAALRLTILAANGAQARTDGKDEGVDERIDGATRGSDATAGTDRLIAVWLLAVAAMVLVMVVLGGLTRLTHSGLSMVEWQPLTGWLPPLSEDGWQAQFAAYQRYPEFRLLNPDMTPAQFKSIFWLEYVHRLWGRMIGVAFFAPFLVFLIQGRIRGRLAAGCAVLFVLGALQGVLGWFMVESGLIENPDVSPYRLTAHFILALLLLGALVLTALGVLYPTLPGGRGGRLRTAPLALVLLILATLTSGGFVAGTDAGYHFNTFPLMDGRLIPEDLFVLDPAWRNAFENVPLVQLIHRLLAVTTLLAVIGWRIASAPTAGHRARAARRQSARRRGSGSGRARHRNPSPPHADWSCRVASGERRPRLGAGAVGSVRDAGNAAHASRGNRRQNHRRRGFAARLRRHLSPHAP